MINLLSAEFYKLRKNRAGLIMVLVNIGIALVIAGTIVFVANFLAEEIRNIMGGDPEAVEAIEYMGVSMGTMESIMLAPTGKNSIADAFIISYQQIVICLGIMAGFSIAGEFEGGTVRNILSVGRRRASYYLSKLAAVFSFGVVLALVTTLIHFTVITGFFGVGEVADGYTNSFLLLAASQFMLYLTYTSLFVFLAFLFRNTGLAIVMSVAFVIAEEIVYMFVIMFPALDMFKSLVELLPYYGVQRTTSAFYGAAEQSEFMWAAIICGVTVVASTIAGIMLFNRRDIK
jgi:ABC-2 type transport system permease protein